MLGFFKKRGFKIEEKFYDTEWRLNNLYKIVTKDRKWVNLKQNNIQRELTRNRHIKRKKILKARQQGVSTNELISQFDYTVFHKNVTACILADCDTNIKKLFRIVQRAYRGLHPAVKPRLSRGGGSMYEYYFPDLNSRIYCALKSRGDTINWLHISETAFIDQTDRIDATVETVPIDGIITHETTANGMANGFYDFWQEDNGYKQFFFPWYFHAEYTLPITEKIIRTDEEKSLAKYALSQFNIKLTDEQITFRRWKKKSNRLFKQEYAEDDQSCFLSTGKSFFDSAIVTELIKDDSVTSATDGADFSFYKPFNKQHDYVCGADTAEGIGGDFSVGVMIDVTSMEVVALLRGQFKPSDFADKLNELCQRYQLGASLYPELAVESNNHGHAVILKLSEYLNYPNLFRHDDERLGWLNNKVTRPILLNTLKDAIEDYNLKINSREILAECLTLVNKNGKIEASEGKHDDCIIATGIALQLSLNYNYLNNLEDRMMV